MFNIRKGSPNTERKVKKAVSGKLQRFPPESGKVDIVSDDQPHNPFTEIQVLSQHTDILRILVKIDKHRCASVGDDAIIVVWDVQLGRKLSSLESHHRPVTCLCVWSHHGNQDVDGPILISAASDKQICMWDVDRVRLLATLTEHGGTARCVVPCLEDVNVFCSGGESLCLWNTQGSLLCKLKQEDEDITAVIAIKNDKLVTVVDKSLVVYSKTGSDSAEGRLNLVKKLPPHRESIRSLIKINELIFASGSLDGAIILWSTQQLTSTKQFNTLKNYEGDDKVYPLSVQYMATFGERYLVAAVGAGFRIYDVVSSALMAEKLNAHYSKVLHVEFVYHGYLLSTCSEDGSIRLWGNKKTFQEITDSSVEYQPAEGTNDPFDKFANESIISAHDLREKGSVMEPDLLGECMGHSGAVQVCVDVDGDSMVSGGKDGLVILWRNGILQTLKRDECIKDILNGTVTGFM